MRRVATLLIGVSLVTAACADLYGSEPTQQDTSTTTVAVSPTAAALPAQSPASPDGRLRLDVPAGYPGVTIDAAIVDPTTIVEPFEVIGAYELGPDGTVFDDPVLVTFDTFLPVTSTDVPVIGVFTGHPGDWVLAPGYRVDAAGSTIVVSAEIYHFSQVIVTRDLARSFTFEPREAVITDGDPIDATWTLVDACPQLAPDVDLSTDDHCTYREALAENVTLTGRTMVTGSATTDPESSPTAFPQEPPPPGEGNWVAATGRAVIGCAGVGSGTYATDVTMSTRATDQTLDSDALARLLFGLEGVRTGSSIVIDQTYVLPPARMRCADGELGDALLATSTVGMDPEDQAEMFGSIERDGRMDTILPATAARVSRIVDVSSIDIRGVAVGSIDINRDAAVRLFDEATFECGATGAHGFTTVCPEDVALMPSGTLVVVAAIHDAPAPRGGDTATFGAFFETNADATDDFVVAEGDDWSLSQGTDRRYRLVGNADGWTATIDGSAVANGERSAVRVLVRGSTVIWLIPSIELGDEPRMRATATIDDSSGDTSGIAADVLGSDPTDPMLTIRF